MRSLDIIVPCYNAAECLLALYEKIQVALICTNVSWQIRDIARLWCMSVAAM